MSWQERLENIQFTIITGDGKIFTPLWKNGIREKAYNVSNYNFIDVPGGFSDRKQPQANKYPLIFWFQGDDNIEQADAFELSADDSRPWQIKHPLYGNFTGQPLSIRRDDSSYNVTEMNVDFWESVNRDFPNAETSINDVLISKTTTVSELAAISYESRLIPKPEDPQIMQDSIIQISSVFDKLFDNENFSDYQTLKSKALNDASNLISSPLQAMTSAHQLLIAPSLFQKSVQSRITALKESFSKLTALIDENPTQSSKLYFESESAVNIAAMCQSTATPIDTDYVTRSEIEIINADIVNTYNDYLQKLDDSQVDIGDENTYHPDAQTQLELYELITETTGNLFALAFEAKQERTILTDKSTNLILLTHKFLGLDADDTSIEDFRQLNIIKNDELFKIKKGRPIKYFV